MCRLKNEATCEGVCQRKIVPYWKTSLANKLNKTRDYTCDQLVLGCVEEKWDMRERTKIEEWTSPSIIAHIGLII